MNAKNKGLPMYISKKYGFDCRMSNWTRRSFKIIETLSRKCSKFCSRKINFNFVGHFARLFVYGLVFFTLSTKPNVWEKSAEFLGPSMSIFFSLALWLLFFLYLRIKFNFATACFSDVVGLILKYDTGMIGV